MVCKDGGAAHVVGFIAQELLLMHAGHEVIVVTEGVGGKQWPGSWPKPVFQGSEDYQIIPFSVDAEAILRYYRPDVVVVGESFPNNLEGQFARAAQQMGIPIVLVEDFWGGFVRIADLAKDPDLILTLDEYAVGLAEARFPRARIAVTGNPGVRRRIADPASQVVDMHRNGNFVVTLCGGGRETAEQIQLLLKCLAITSGEWRLVPRWHPKEANRPDPENGNRPYQEIWDALLAPLGDRVVRVDGPVDNVVVASDRVCGAYSTLLTTAAQAGVTAVSLVTSQVRQSLEMESAAREIPHVALGMAHLVEAPVDLASLWPCSIEIRSRIKPFNPLVGALEICTLVRERLP